MDRIETNIRNIVSEISGLPADANADADLYLELGVPSFHALQLLTELEERFSIHIPDEQFVDATSISLLAKTVRGLIEQSR